MYDRAIISGKDIILSGFRRVGDGQLGDGNGLHGWHGDTQ